MKDVVSYNIEEITSSELHSEKDIIYSLKQIAKELAENNKYLTLDNADDLIAFTLTDSDIYLKYFPAIDCNGDNIIVFYLYDETEHAEYFLKARTDTKYEDDNKFSEYGMRLYYHIDCHDCVFYILDDGKIETEISYCGEIYQRFVVIELLDFVDGLKPNVIKDIKTIKQQVEVRCKLAGFLQKTIYKHGK